MPLIFFSVSRWEFANPYKVSARSAVTGEKSDLCVYSHVLEQACYTSKTLIKVMPFLQRIRDSLVAISPRNLRSCVSVHTFNTFSYSFECARCTFSVAVM